MNITKALLESVINGQIVESDDHWGHKYTSAAGHALDKANMQTADSPDYHMWMGVHHHHLADAAHYAGKGKRVVDAHNREAQRHTKKVSKTTPEGSRFHQGLTRHWELP